MPNTAPQSPAQRGWCGPGIDRTARPAREASGLRKPGEGDGWRQAPWRYRGCAHASQVEPAKEARKRAPPKDRGEPIGLMEPMLVGESSRHRAALTDLAVELAARAAGFRRSLPTGVLSALADLVRAMNCYYSNLIEGHDTHPVDIERALKNEYSAEREKRNLQLEARAHIAVQQWIDGGCRKNSGRERAQRKARNVGAA